MGNKQQKLTYSKVGLAFVVFYLILTLICVIWAFTVSDPKGKFVLLQLPVALQLVVVQELGYIKLLVGLSWFVIYPLIIIPTLVILYQIGAMINSFLNMIRVNRK